MSDSFRAVDDKSISDESMLWRRIPPYHVIYDGNLGRRRPSKAAFCDHPDGSPMSVILGDEVIAAGRRPDSVLENLEDFSLASVSVGFARSKGQGVIRKSLEEEPAHAEVIGNKTDSIRRAFAKAAEWIVSPAEESI